MRKLTKNWLKVSMLTIDVGEKVLRQLLSEIVQASFLNDSECFWLETVQKIKNTNCAASLLLSFTNDIRDKDETCRGNLKPLIMFWRLTKGQRLTWSEQVKSLEQWEEDIVKRMRFSQSNDKDMLSSWRRQIQDTIRTLHSMPTCLNSWTNDLLHRFQQYRQDLQIKTKEYYDDLLSSSREKLKNCASMDKRKLREVITNLQSNREKMQKTWKMESEKYFKSVGQNIRDLVTSWSKSTIIPEWKKLLDDFETEASEMDDTKLQMSCDSWHAKLHDLFDQLLKDTHTSKTARRNDLLRKSWKKLNGLPSIESQQVNDFLISICRNKKLQKQLSEEQHSTLYPSSGIANLKECDMTLLSILLKSCLVYPPMQGWNDKPRKCDNSVGADILRLQSYRRDIIVYTDKFQIDVCTFEQLWHDINGVLCRLASRSGDKYEKKISDKCDNIKSLPSNRVSLSLVSRILDVCKNDILADLNGKLEHRKYKKLKKSIKRVKREKLRMKKMYERTDRSSDSGSERSGYSSDSERTDRSSDSGSERSGYSSDSERTDRSSDSGSERSGYSSDSERTDRSSDSGSERSGYSSDSERTDRSSDSGSERS